MSQKHKPSPSISNNIPNIPIQKEKELNKSNNSEDSELPRSPKAEILPKSPVDFFFVDQMLTSKVKSSKTDKKSIKKVTKEEKEKRKEEELRKAEEEKAKKKEEMKKKKEEKEIRKLQEKMKNKEKKSKDPKSEGGSELSFSEDSSLTEVSEDITVDDQEWAEILNFNPNFEEDQTELDWSEASKAESFEEYARYMKETHYNVPASALIYDPFQSRLLGDIGHDFPPYTQLPEVVVKHIFTFLDFQDILTVMKVCKQWREFTHDKQLWLDLYTRTERKYWPMEETKNIWEELGTEDLQRAIQNAIRNSSCNSPKRTGGTRNVSYNTKETSVPALRIQLTSSTDNANPKPPLHSVTERRSPRRDKPSDSRTPHTPSVNINQNENKNEHESPLKTTNTSSKTSKQSKKPNVLYPQSEPTGSSSSSKKKLPDLLSASEDIVNKSPSSPHKERPRSARRGIQQSEGSQKQTSLKRSASVRARSNSINSNKTDKGPSRKQHKRSKNNNDNENENENNDHEVRVRERSNSSVGTNSKSKGTKKSPSSRERSVTVASDYDTPDDTSPHPHTPSDTFLSLPDSLPPPPPPLVDVSVPNSNSSSKPQNSMVRSKTLSTVDTHPILPPPDSTPIPPPLQLASQSPPQSISQSSSNVPTNSTSSESHKSALPSSKPLNVPTVNLKHPQSTTNVSASPPKNKEMIKSQSQRVVSSQITSHPPEKKNTHTSLNQLVASVTPYENLPDMMDQQTFIATYSTFTTTPALVRKLIQRFQVPKLGKDEEEIKIYQHLIERPIKLRVAKLLKVLIDTYYTEFSPQLKELLSIFIVGIADPEYSATLRKSMEKGAELVRSHEAKTLKKEKTQNETSTKKSNVTAEQILSCSAEEIAQQLTLIEFETYSSIKPAEFFNQAWAKATTWDRAPHIRQMIDRFNALTRWIATIIVSEEKIRMRVKRFVKFIKIADCLRKMHNYHTLMAVLSGLNEGPVYRLKHTRAEIPQRWAQTFQELQDLMKAEFSYRAYREELANAQPPCIPYIGIYLRDLTYFEESGGSAEKGMINFKKNRNVYGVIQIIQKYQEVPYTFKKNEKIYNYLKNLKGLDDTTLSNLSMKIEPRNCKRSDLE